MLKDLVVKESEVNEELIEKIVVPYLKYTDTGKILPNEKFRKLRVADQILVYLTAKLGWKFISEVSDPSQIYATNTELEAALHIPGNTLRPKVKQLRDEGYVVTKDGKHQVSDHAPSYILTETELGNKE